PGHLDAGELPPDVRLGARVAGTQPGARTPDPGPALAVRPARGGHRRNRPPRRTAGGAHRPGPRTVPATVVPPEHGGLARGHGGRVGGVLARGAWSRAAWRHRAGALRGAFPGVGGDPWP